MRNHKKHKDAYIFIVKRVCLSILDKKWQDHIQDLNNIRLGVSLAGYGGKDPLNEFRKASFASFNQLVYEIQKQIVILINNINLSEQSKGRLSVNDLTFDFNKKDWSKKLYKEDWSQKLKDKKVQRNSPCPCGSGKKFKHCHGKS